jgi:Tol biopolymer transport system component
MKKILLSVCLLAALSFPCRCGPTPGGGRIAFVSDRDGNPEIYVINADPSTGSGHSGSGVTRLTNNPAEDRCPSWSPDGSRITFDSDRDGNREIYVMNADPSAGSGHSGSGQTNLTNSPAPDAWPSWGP